MNQRTSEAVEWPLSRKVRFLKDPGHYPEPTAAVEAKETHMSWIFLTDSHAFKLKKPVKYPYLDFSTPDKRRQDAEREVALNSRLAGQTYIGVMRLTLDEDDTLSLEGDGRPIDFLVKMHRLPEDRMLDRLLEEDRVPAKGLVRAARRLSDFYLQAAAVDLSGEEYIARLAREIADNQEGLAATGSIDRELTEHSHAALRDCFTALREDLATRAAEGRILDGHGDLRPEHICLTEDPVFFDCLEFNQQLRSVDPLDELAYLDIECQRYRHSEAAAVFLAVYGRVSNDPCPPEVFRFYQAKRAFLRASLCAGHLGEDAYDGSREWIEKTHWYLRKTRQTLQPATV